MYIQLGNEKIDIDLNSGIKVFVHGPEKYYYVQVSEYVDGNDLPKYVEGYVIAKDDFKFKKFYTLPIEFFMDFEITVLKFVDGIGLSQIFSHRFNDYGKYVRFILETENLNECKKWVEKIEEYKIKRNCEIVLSSAFPELNKKYSSFYNSKNITPYKTYRIGRFPKSSNDFRTLDPRCEVLIWFGYCKKFWSYQHPRLWKSLNSEEIVKDILGL